MNIIEEESLARDMPLNARIHTAEIPPDDPKQLEVVARSLYNQYRHVFKDYEEAEYFTMLPLSMRQRDHVLARAVASDPNNVFISSALLAFPWMIKRIGCFTAI